MSTIAGKLIVFGSGELSTVGRNIHESVIRNISPPVRIALLETPAGYEDNPHHWYEKMKKMMQTGLINHKPEILLIPALRSDGIKSTNNPDILSPLLSADYIHTGAGSPSYAVKHLKDSLALQYIKNQLMKGIPISIASAVAVAFSRYALPVYEIYFAGHDPSWISGLDFFQAWNLNLTFLPHWNNHEGGKDIDTRFTYMGEKRLKKLLAILPGPTTIIGIDEHTALIFDFSQKKAMVKGKGSIHIMKGKNSQIINKGDTFSFEDLKI